jgi:integrase
LKAVREAMLAHEITRRVKVVDGATGEVRLAHKVVRTGMARKTINKLVGCLKRVFAWAVEEELVPVEVHAALARVKGLRKGKTPAREMARVRLVPPGHVEAVLPLLRPPIRVMVEFQRLTGCRPQDVVQLRPCDVNTGGPVWEYAPHCFPGLGKS